MAQRRMFSLEVCDTDAFLDLPVSSQALYFHLGMRADDDGFVSNPKKITTMVNCSADDLKLLFAKGFVIPFNSGVCVIRDWRVNNYIQKDRYHETRYLAEKSTLSVESNQSYAVYPPCIQSVSSLDTEGRLVQSKISKGKNNVVDNPQASAKRFTPPTVEQVRAYCTERRNMVDPQRFVDFYESKGWVVGKAKMKDWKAAVRNWEREDSKNARSERNDRSGHPDQEIVFPGITIL